MSSSLEISAAFVRSSTKVSSAKPVTQADLDAFLKNPISPKGQKAFNEKRKANDAWFSQDTVH